MERKEMLELAAKAAGYKVEFHGSSCCRVINENGDLIIWEPDMDELDAFRLSVRLKLSICHTLDSIPLAEGKVMVGLEPWNNKSPLSYVRYYFESDLDERCQAACIAITRAAAELGRGMA